MKRYRLAMAVLWTIAIMIMCWLPGPMVRKLEDPSRWFKLPNLDKLVHCGIFVLFSILWARLWLSRWRFVWIALGGLALAAITEVAQNLPVVGRDGSISDTLTDLIGVSIGLAVAPLVEPLVRSFESRLVRRTASATAALECTIATVEELHRPSS